MNFELEPWEIPPGAGEVSVAIEFGPVDWQGEPTMVSARWLELTRAENLVFLRHHANRMNFLVVWDEAPFAFSERINSKRLGEIARDCLQSQDYKCGRPFYLQGSLCLWMLESAFWSPPTLSRAATPFEIPLDRKAEPSNNVFDWLQRQWNDADSPVRFAWEWNRKDEKARNEYFAQTIPRWREIHAVMNAIALVTELTVGNWWTLDHVDTHNHAPEFLARLQPWRELVIAHFPPFKPLPASKPKFLREYFQFASGHIQVKGVDATAHQQIEARLLLRDWLQRNAPDKLYLVQ